MNTHPVADRTAPHLLDSMIYYLTNGGSSRQRKISFLLWRLLSIRGALKLLQLCQTGKRLVKRIFLAGKVQTDQIADRLPEETRAG